MATAVAPITNSGSSISENVGLIAKRPACDDHAGAAERDDEPDLHRPQDAAERRGQRPRPGAERNGRRFEKPSTGGRLHVGHQVLVGCQTIEQLGVRIRVSLRDAQPAAVFDQGSQQPRDRAHDGQKADQECQAREALLDRPDDGQLRVAAVVTELAEIRDEEPGVVRNLGVLRPGTPRAPGRAPGRRDS